MQINFKGLWGSTIISQYPTKNSPKLSMVIRHDYYPFQDETDEFTKNVIKQNTRIEYNSDILPKNVESQQEFVIVHEPLTFSEKIYLDYVNNKTDEITSKLIAEEISDKDLKL